MATVYRGVGTLAARIACKDPIFPATAEAVATAARGFAGAHFRTGNYVSGIGTTPIRGRSGVTDQLAFVDDPGAAAIEWGHMTRDGSRYVPGLHIMQRAADAVGG